MKTVALIFFLCFSLSVQAKVASRSAKSRHRVPAKIARSHPKKTKKTKVRSRTKSRQRVSALRSRRSVASSGHGSRARAEIYFRKDTLAAARAGGFPTETLPPRTKVGIKHSVH